MAPLTEAYQKAIGAMLDAGEWPNIEVVGHLADEVSHLQEQLREALKGRLLVPLVNVERDICRMSTRVTIELPYDQFDACHDRQEFRKNLSERLNTLGDRFLAAWDQLHGETK